MEKLETEPWCRRFCFLSQGKEYIMSDGQVKRTMPRALISLLITLAIGAVWFYISLPAINLHNTSFYSFVFILL